MLFLSNEGNHDPTINLALEEYALRKLPLTDGGLLLFYVNEPSIIIGRNQNTAEEINQDYVESHGIRVVRRLSGGGAVYHDLGNLNFSFITLDDGESFRNFAKFTQPVITALRKLGVDAELSGRNDIQVGDKKISGNAQFAAHGRMFSHGTLLFDSDIDQVVSALKVNAIKFASKSTKSVRARVGNIRDYLMNDMTIEQFRQALLREIFATAPKEIPMYQMSSEDWEAVHQLANERYRSWEWNYGRSPKFNVEHSHKFASGIVHVRLFVEKGSIQACKIYGDFFGIGEIADVENVLIGVKHEPAALRDVLANLDVERYLGGVTKEDLVSLLMLKDVN